MQGRFADAGSAQTFSSEGCSLAHHRARRAGPRIDLFQPHKRSDATHAALSTRRQRLAHS
ncbi:hypothetical protein BCEN4_440005 [Burkholderia cenocepacia]|nr:hypothetical protein BCEN4_440005 [Burkholderia cenocepacia]